MKKEITYMIIGVILFIIIIAGSTYSFLNASVTNTNAVNANSHDVNIVYSSSGSLNDNISVVSSRDEGSSTTINMYTTSNSISPLINLYINIQSMTSNLSIEGFIWEVCAVRGNETPICNDGNFSGYNSTNNNVVPILSNYRLTTENTAFTIYLWLDGSKINTSLTGATFSGYVDAKSENFSATFS